jgi:hypothetical protein
MLRLRKGFNAMQEFKLSIQNEKASSYKKMAFFIILINLAVFAILGYYTDKSSIRSIAIATIIAVVSTSLLSKFLPAKKKEIAQFEIVSLLLMVAAWVLMKFWWPAVILLLLLGLYKLSQRDFTVSISSTSVVYPSFPRMEISWDQLNNVVLKDDLLTIDFKNNKIIQQLIQKKEPAVDEQEFNDFCKAQLKQS